MQQTITQPIAFSNDSFSYPNTNYTTVQYSKKTNTACHQHIKHAQPFHEAKQMKNKTQRDILIHDNVEIHDIRIINKLNIP